jgi:hypothetical protein
MLSPSYFAVSTREHYLAAFTDIAAATTNSCGKMMVPVDGPS